MKILERHQLKRISTILIYLLIKVIAHLQLKLQVARYINCSLLRHDVVPVIQHYYLIPTELDVQFH